jgi:hypothetical protein
MMKRLAADVIRDPIYVSGTDGRGTIALGPAKIDGTRCTASVDPMRRGSFHPLHQPGQHRCWMESQEHVQVCGHNAEFNNPAPFLANDDWQMLREVRRTSEIDIWHAPPSGPDHVEMEVVVHVGSSVDVLLLEYRFYARPVALATPAEPSLQRRAGLPRSADGTSRAVAPVLSAVEGSATSSRVVA